MLVLLLHLGLQVMMECLVKMENALNLWVEDRNRKHVPMDGDMWSQRHEAYTTFHQGIP